MPPDFSAPSPIPVAQMHMAGRSTPAIAKALKSTPKAVSAVLKAKPTRAILKEMKDRLLHEGLPKATEIVLNVIHSYEDPLETDHLGRATQEGLQRREHGMKASMRLLEATGLLPSPQAPILITNIDKSTTIIPLINVMLAKEMQTVAPVVDVTPVAPVTEVEPLEENINPFE